MITVCYLARGAEAFLSNTQTIANHGLPLIPMDLPLFNPAFNIAKRDFSLGLGDAASKHQARTVL